MRTLPSFSPRLRSLTALAATAWLLAGCGISDRISAIGSPPAFSQITNPETQPGYKPVSLPMPQPQVGQQHPNSLWRTGSKAFFRDQRASQVGDILTVLINIADSAQLKDESTRTRTNTEVDGISNLFGLEKVLPAKMTASSLVNTNGATSNDGVGNITRNETVTLKLSSVITQVLPNGNLVIQGRQEVRVNFELRDLQINGVIRPSDINSANQISYEKIAEARISYGGRGQNTDVQQPRWGTQLFDTIYPF